MALTCALFTIHVKASGGEPMEGSRLEQFELENTPLFDGFAEMDYCLFLETNLKYEASLDYDRYGIYGDFVQTEQEGEEVYFALNEKLIGSKLALYTHEEWYDNKEPFIQDMSPDLEWIISRQYSSLPFHTDKIYYQGNVLEQKEGIEWIEMALFGLQRKADSETYEQMGDEKVKRWERIIRKARGWDDDAFWEHWAKNASAIDEYGKLLAVASPDNESIGIYSMESEEELLHMEMADSIDTDWPIEVSQIKGTAESGWLVFSSGDVTYRMTYPDGSLEKLGEFMYGTTFSPDEKYLAYCTGNIVLDDLWEELTDEEYAEKLEKCHQVYAGWKTVGNGWYVVELETGNKTYIPIPVEEDTWGTRPLSDGRCVWIQKDALLQILNSEAEEIEEVKEPTLTTYQIQDKLITNQEIDDTQYQINIRYPYITYRDSPDIAEKINP